MIPLLLILLGHVAAHRHGGWAGGTCSSPRRPRTVARTPRLSASAIDRASDGDGRRFRRPQLSRNYSCLVTDTWHTQIRLHPTLHATVYVATAALSLTRHKHETSQGTAMPHTWARQAQARLFCRLSCIDLPAIRAEPLAQCWGVPTSLGSPQGQSHRLL